MKNLTDQIRKQIEAMLKEMSIAELMNNKSAYRRARVASKRLEKMLLKYRKDSPK